MNRPNPLPRPICVGGLPIVPLTLEQWAEHIIATAIARRAEDAAPAFFTSANGHVLSRAARDPEFRRILLASDAIDADGQPLVMATSLLRRRLPGRSCTTDLLPRLAALAPEDFTFYFLGGTETVNRKGIDFLLDRHPRMRIVGRRNGYFSADEEASVIEEIRQARPHLLIVGMGVPREQAFVHRNLSRLRGVGAIRTCGGALDIFSGRLGRPPRWVQV
jgi:N-acetylglucosaminyldiphosphoundecaprenol N-acetyl-beta-D-mannosaminyltransferase